jgi:glyoxylase-like metal-dependent hydrolase (beta-lactamase superfamily II)
MVEVLKGVHSIDFSGLGGLGLECWLLNCPEGLVLVDGGMRENHLEIIESELGSIGKKWSDIGLVLITHKHGDHTANLGKIKELTGAPIKAHKGDASDIADSRGIPVDSLEHGQVIQYCGGIEVIHVPGHSDGNVCYYLHATKAILAGDTVFGDSEGNLESPPERYCKDVDMAKEGIKKLLDYDFEAILLTHGKNSMENAKEKIKRLCS